MTKSGARVIGFFTFLFPLKSVSALFYLFTFKKLRFRKWIINAWRVCQTKTV